jgi:hypothetical protein
MTVGRGARGSFSVVRNNNEFIEREERGEKNIFFDLAKLLSTKSLTLHCPQI